MKKKTLSAIMAVTLTAAMLAGCGGNNSPKEEQKPEKETEEKKEEPKDEAEQVSEGGKTNWSNPEEWKKRHSVDDIYNMLTDLEKNYPEYAELGSLGQTTKGNDIKVLTITDESVDASTKTGIGWLANIHGDEREAGESGAYAAAWMLENLEDQTVQEILKNHIVYVVPILNPDSHNIYEYFVRGTSQELDKNGDGEACNDLYEDITGDEWIGQIYASSGKNEEDPWSTFTGYAGYESKDLDGNGWLGDDSWASGYDINRNFDFMWEEGKEYNGKSGGESAASEVETQLIQKFMEEHPMDALASLHTGFQTVLYPWCYRPADEANAQEMEDIKFMADTSEKMRAAFEKTAQRNFYTMCSHDDYQTYCELIDYAYGVHGIHAYTVEVYSAGGDETTAYDPNHDPADPNVCAWNDTDYPESRMDYFEYDEFVKILEDNGLKPDSVKMKVLNEEGDETGEETTLAAMKEAGKMQGIYVYASDRNARGSYVPEDQDMMVEGAKDALLQMIYAEGKVKDPAQ